MIDLIHRCLAAHQIHSRPAYQATGPRITVWALELPVAAMARALRLQTAMAAALDCPGVALRQHGRLLLVEVPRRRGQTVDLETIGPALGVTATGRRVGISLDRTRPHAIVAGMTGSGKSETVRTIALLESRRPEARLILIDLKASGMWDELGALGHTVASDQAAADAALRWAAARIGAGLPGRVVVVVDEAGLLDTEGRRLVLEIAERGRADGLHLVLATQMVRSDVLDRRITTSAYWRLCGSVFGAGASRLVLEQAGAERLTGRGDFLLSECGAPAVRFQAALAGPGAWRHARAVAPLELEPAAASVHPGHVRADDAEALEWARANWPTSARQIQLNTGVGMDRARRVRDVVAGEAGEAYGLTTPRETVIRPDFAALVAAQ